MKKMVKPKKHEKPRKRLSPKLNRKWQKPFRKLSPEPKPKPKKVSNKKLAKAIRKLFVKPKKVTVNQMKKEVIAGVKKLKKGEMLRATYVIKKATKKDIENMKVDPVKSSAEFHQLQLKAKAIEDAKKIAQQKAHDKLVARCAELEKLITARDTRAIQQENLMKRKDDVLRELLVEKAQWSDNTNKLLAKKQEEIDAREATVYKQSCELVDAKKLIHGLNKQVDAYENKVEKQNADIESYKENIKDLSEHIDEMDEDYDILMRQSLEKISTLESNCERDKAVAKQFVEEYARQRDAYRLQLWNIKGIAGKWSFLPMMKEILAVIKE